MIGRTIAHYRITAAIGSGGMGEVYRATDTKLGRDVAIKVLPPEMAASPERLERFQREAKALAALDHPGIVTVHSVEQADGVHFLTMQLVEGQPLARLIPEGGMPVERIVVIATALAEALAAAHDKGIVHRDLQPGNVMVTTDGRVKVLDFGLAKVEGSSEVADSELSTLMRTREGVVMGTVPYMSPEQVSGMKVDHRTDIFSLGILVYEMATGRRPFQGRSPAELASAILRDAPLEQSRSDLPEGLQRVIARCLQKKLDDRFPTAREAAEALRNLPSRPASVAPAPPAAGTPALMPSTGARPKEGGFWVAVLPFKHRGAEPGVLALAEGLTEDIVTGLSRFSYLRVIARSSTSRYSGEGLDVRSVGQELGARYVMDGSVRQAGSTLRIAVQLVDATSSAHLWAETYNRSFDPDAIFELQDELVPRIVSTVADWYGILPRSMNEAVRSKPVGELSPYEALLRAFGYYWRVTPQEHAAVRPILERAVEEAPGHAAAWAMLSMLYGEEDRFGFNVLPDPLGRSLQAARRAVEAAPESHVSHLALAQAHYFRKEFEAFRSAAERALALNPLDGATVEYLAHLLAFAGDWERGSELDKRARLLNPHHPAWYWAVPLLDAYRKGDYQGARAVAPKALMPGQYYSHALFAAVYGQLGEREAASGHVREVLALRPDFAEIARDQFGKWYLPELVEHLIDGLRKAGLQIPSPR
ncbi:MAG TPA: protein kinase [Vicinamibacteria bacterium]|nr:protein kinase [Vicinamibacteria bacterium]